MAKNCVLCGAEVGLFSERTVNMLGHNLVVCPDCNKEISVADATSGMHWSSAFSDLPIWKTAGLRSDIMRPPVLNDWNGSSCCASRPSVVEKRNAAVTGR